MLRLTCATARPRLGWGHLRWAARPFDLRTNKRGPERRIGKLLDATFALFREHGFVRGDEQVDRKAAAKSAAVILQEKPVASTDFDEITNATLLVPELSTQMFGDIEDEDAETEVHGILRALIQSAGLVQ